MKKSLLDKFAEAHFDISRLYFHLKIYFDNKDYSFTLSALPSWDVKYSINLIDLESMMNLKFQEIP